MAETGSSNTYVIDIENGAETARLLDQDRLFTRGMGGLFPEDPDLSAVEHVLDLACGPGGWAIEVAHLYRDIEVVGIDLSQTMVKYARARARVQQLDHVAFEVMDVREPLAFDDGSFDLINARFIVGFMDRSGWPRLLVECARLLTPGGLLRLTECEMSVSNSSALQQLNGYLYQALACQQRTFSVDGRSIGIAHMLGQLLADAGFQQVEQRCFLLDSSYGVPLYEASCWECQTTYALLKPYLLQSGLVDAVTYDPLYQQMLQDLHDPHFRSVSFGLTIWGRTPGRTG